MVKIVAILAATLGLCLGANAQTYPSKPIELVVPFAPGGSVNLLGRLLASRMSEALGQQVVVQNKPGAGGSIGATYAAKASPDGYTLLMASISNQSILPLLNKKLSYSPSKDFVPVALFSTVSNVLVVSNDIPAMNIAELLQYAKENPGKMNMGSSGTGSVNHLTGELFMLRTGINLTHVPYKGMGPAKAGLLGGEVQILFSNLPTVITQIKSGQVRALGVASEQRSPTLPGVPTFAEAGVKDAEVESWSAVVAPAATNPEIVKKLQDTVIKIANEKTMIEQLAKQGASPYPGTSADLAKRIKDDTRRWEEVIKHAKIQLD